MSRPAGGATVVGIGIGGALTVAILWTCVFGAFWQWPPILAACGMGLLILRLGKKAGH